MTDSKTTAPEPSGANSTGKGEGSLQAPFRHPIAWQDEAYYDLKAIENEMERVFDMCH